MGNTLKTLKWLFTLSAIIILLSCKKETSLMHETGMIKNLTGFDGCGWVIQYNQNGTTKTLEPLNLSDFKAIITDGQTVDFTYYKTNSPSVCMVGDVIKLTSLKNK